TNSNPYSRNRSDRQQPGAITLGKRGRLGRGAQVLPTASAAEVSAARPGRTFRNAHRRPVPGHVWTAPAMQEESDYQRSVRVRSCIRPLSAAVWPLALM